MKNIIKFVAFIWLLISSISCSKDKDIVEKDTPVSYATIEGNWKRISWRNEPINDKIYLYVVLQRRDNKFELYSNMSSSLPLKRTGTYKLILKDDQIPVISGLYDYEGGYWSSDYYVNITDNQMTWVSVKDDSDISVYEKCTEIPK